MTSNEEDLKKSLMASELKTLAEKGCGNCFQQDCNWPECSPKAMHLRTEMGLKT